MSDIYPLVIVKDRYNGTYSGGKWTAWNLNYVPSKADADDIECADFFSKNNIVYGRGETPEEAIEDLKMILDCGISDPDESTEDEEEKDMEPTSVWEIENIDEISITQDGDEISLLLKNRDDLTKITLTGDAIKKHNDEFVTILKVDIEECNKIIKEIEKKMHKLEEKNKMLEIEKKELKKKYINKNEELSTLKLNTPITDAMLVDDYNRLVEENKKLKDKVEHVEPFRALERTIREKHELKKELDLEKAANEAQHKFIREYAGKGTEVQFNYAIDDAKEVSYVIVDRKENERIKENLQSQHKMIVELNKANCENCADEEAGDNVNHPSHYTGRYECIDVMQDVFGDEATNDFCLCNAFKYIWRARKKNGLEDVKKAVWYLNKYIEEAEKDGVPKGK